MIIRIWYQLSSIDIQTYYSKCLEGYKIGKREYSPVKAATVKRRHSNIRKALQYAYEMELIQKNPELKWLLKHPEEVKQLTERSEEIGFAKYSQPILNDMEEVLQLCILLRRFEPSESS